MNKIIQQQFQKFHDNIKLDFDDNSLLAAKRDMLIEEIKTYLKKKSEEENRPMITFESFNQGSYSMGTGNKAAHEEDDHDIDVGLMFFISKEDYSPLEVKKWVFEALNSKPNRTVEWKKACIRVQYTEKGIPKFHVDFACYSGEESNTDRKTYIAKGTPTCAKESNKWEISEPKRLKEFINNKYSDTEDKNQFKRVIRFKKRWKDLKFESKNGKPTGIALTALAYNGFRPYTKNEMNNQPEVDDLRAELEFTKFILSQFSYWNNRIKVELPVPPHNDLFAKMTDDQCAVFKQKLERLRDSLKSAMDEPDPHEACKILQKEYGSDFPIPPKENTGQSRKVAVAGTSESA